MDFKLILICISTIDLVWGRSFTLIIDTTMSMQEEIDVLRRNMPVVADVLRNATDFEDFIVVPFKDHGVASPIISTTPDKFLQSLGDLTVSGGHDCPEDSLSGIQTALELSKPESFIYVFTDAYSNDNSKFSSIETLCKNSRSQVVIFLSGECSESATGPRGYVDIYYDIAKSCSGAVFRFNAVNLKKAFKYIEEMVATDWNDITSLKPFTGYKLVQTTVDTFTRDFLVAVSGDYPTLQIVDATGNSPQMQKIVDTSQSLVVRVMDFNPGVYQLMVRSQVSSSLTVYKKTQLPFEYGFSTRRPRSLKETSLRPIPGWLNFILIVLSPVCNIELTSLEVQMTDGDAKQSLAVNQSEIYQKHYISSVFVAPDKSFRCVIHGRDTVTYEEVSGSTKIVDVQKSGPEPTWIKPVVEIIDLDSNLVDFGTDTTIACKVKGYPKPEIRWENDDPGSVLATEEILLEMPSTYINYVTVNVTSNSTLYCKAKNAQGDDETSFDLFVNRTFTFDVIETPKDKTIEYGTEGKLYCKVAAYPDIEVRWYRNDTLIEYLDNIEVVLEDYALVIKNMSLDDVGSYKCEVHNSVRNESFTAEVTISGLESPKVEIENFEIVLQPGDQKEIECRIVKGNPRPQITWKYHNSEFESEIPKEAYVKDDKLRILGNTGNKGIYKCVATNIMGEDSRDITVKIQYAPIITNSEDRTVIVTEGDVVELKCDVDAVPKATVRWEMTQDDVIVTLDDRHKTNDRNTHRFYALWRDSGNYHCIADNGIGKTEKTITVNVLVAPYIQPPEARVVETAAGSNVSLPCDVLFGNPVPATKWEFIANDSSSSVLSRGSSSAQLHLWNVSRANEGMYLCIADNEVGNDRIKIYLKIK